MVEVDSLARELASLSVDGVTLSGGEPMEQASALCHLVDEVRAIKDLSFLCYTGYTLEHLRNSGTEGQRELLRKLDILIDGPYLQERHTELSWIGSDNQRIHLLSERYLQSTIESSPQDAALEFTVTEDGSIFWIGIPPRGFDVALMNGLANLGITFDEIGSFYE